MKEIFKNKSNQFKFLKQCDWYHGQFPVRHPAVNEMETADYSVSKYLMLRSEKVKTHISTKAMKNQTTVDDKNCSDSVPPAEFLSFGHFQTSLDWNWAQILGF